jgi:hypothetical protein
MDATALDTITGAFIDALEGGTNALYGLSIPLLGVFAIIAFYVQLGPMVAAGSAHVGDAVASVLLSLLKTGVFYWLLQELPDLAIAAFETFLQWGLTPRSCTSSLRIIPSHPKPGKMPHINTCWRGQRHGVTSCFLSARPVRTHLALHHVVPHPAQAPGDGSGRTR